MKRTQNNLVSLFNSIRHGVAVIAQPEGINPSKVSYTESQRRAAYRLRQYPTPSRNPF